MSNIDYPETIAIPGVYTYKYLPHLAEKILDKHLLEFCNEQLKYAREYNVPLLKFLSHFTEAELIEISCKSITEFCEYLIANKASEQIKDSTIKWMSNQLEIVGKYDVVAEDITLINHVRGKSLKNFAYRLYRDDAIRRELLEEIDDFLLGSTTTSANTYIRILKDQIQQEVDYNARLSQALPGFIYVYDVRAKQLIHSNEKLIDVLGYEKKELEDISSNFYQSIIHAEDYDGAIQCRHKLMGHRLAVCSFECRLKDKQGNNRWLRFYETNLKTQPDGKTLEIIGVAFDISHEKEITNALALSENQLLEAQGIAHIGSYEWDIQGLKTTISTPEIHRIFEMEHLDKFEVFMNHVHKDDVQMVHDAIAESFKTGKYHCVYRYVRNNKEKIIWSQGVVTNVDGVPTTMVGTVQDVTIIKTMEAELREKANELEKSNERLQEFAAIASHDLKEPLRKISLFSSKVLLAEKEMLSENSNMALTKIVDSAVRLQKMIEEILAFSFFSSSQQKESVSLESLIVEVKELLSETIRDKEAIITTDQLPQITVIAPQIKQVFQNLISNALKFSKPDEKPVITITHAFESAGDIAPGDEEKLLIYFRDNGIGFDDKEQAKIFGLFYRLHDKSTFEGTGLGLSISQKILENHGGRISATSTPGKGSTFILELPVGGMGKVKGER